MIYNTTHKEYRLGLGLFFKLVFGHVMNKNGWVVISNIQQYNYKKLEGTDEESCLYEVMAILRREINLDFIPEQFTHFKK